MWKEEKNRKSSFDEVSDVVDEVPIFDKSLFDSSSMSSGSLSSFSQLQDPKFIKKTLKNSSFKVKELQAGEDIVLLPYKTENEAGYSTYVYSGQMDLKVTDEDWNFINERSKKEKIELLSGNILKVLMTSFVDAKRHKKEFPIDVLIEAKCDFVKGNGEQKSNHSRVLKFKIGHDCKCLIFNVLDSLKFSSRQGAKYYDSVAKFYELIVGLKNRIKDREDLINAFKVLNQDIDIPCKSMEMPQQISRVLMEPKMKEINKIQVSLENTCRLYSYSYIVDFINNRSEFVNNENLAEVELGAPKQKIETPILSGFLYHVVKNKNKTLQGNEVLEHLKSHSYKEIMNLTESKLKKKPYSESSI